jgi:hypothetical protein
VFDFSRIAIPKLKLRLEHWTQIGAGVLAVLLWLNASFRTIYEHTFTVPIILENLPAGLVPLEQLPDRATVQVEGTGRELLRLWSNVDNLVIDGAGFREGTTTVYPRVSYLKIPRDINLKEIRIMAPRSLDVMLDRLTTRKMKVQCRCTVVPKEGWVLVGEPRFSPAEVEVVGPASLVYGGGYAVFAESTNFRQVSGAVTADLKLAIDRSRISCKVKKVRYTATVQRLVERVIKDVPVSVWNVPDNMKLVLDRQSITLTVAGGESLVSALRKDDVLATLDYRRIIKNPGNSHAALINLPPALRLVKAEPQRFSLREKIILYSKRKR